MRGEWRRTVGSSVAAVDLHYEVYGVGMFVWFPWENCVTGFFHSVDDGFYTAKNWRMGEDLLIIVN